MNLKRGLALIALVLAILSSSLVGVVVPGGLPLAVALLALLHVT